MQYLRLSFPDIWQANSRVRPMSNADQICSAVARTLKKGDMLAKTLYLLKHLVADLLMRNPSLHYADVTGPYRHNPASGNVGKAYAQSDLGKRAARTLSRRLHANTTRRTYGRQSYWEPAGFVLGIHLLTDRFVYLDNLMNLC
jgi:hypothetical protein